MTLVLSAATPGFVVQASDRLLTKTVGDQHAPHDEMANKSILYRARDGIAAISYSGVAYVEKQPTDEWIAERLWGAPFVREPNGRDPPTIGFGKRRNDHSVDQAVATLKKAFDSLPQRLIDQGGISVDLTGWRLDPPVRPFLIEIERLRLAATSSVSGIARSPSSKNLWLGGIGAGVNFDSINTAFDRFRPSNVLTIENTEQTFVEQIRHASRANDTVGPNVLAILMPVPPSGPVIVRFHPTQPHQVRVTGGAGSIDFDVAHTPWILGLSFYFAPSATVENSGINLDGVPVHLEAPPGRGGLRGFWTSLKRPPP